MNELLCERCTQPLNEEDAVWLWMNHDGRLRTERDGDWPEGESQGAFAYGKRCAKLALGEGYGRRVQAGRSRYR